MYNVEFHTCTEICTHGIYTHIYEVLQVCTHNMNISITIFQYFTRIFQYFAVAFVIEVDFSSFSTQLWVFYTHYCNIVNIFFFEFELQ